MPSNRFVLKFPSDTIRLNGAIRNTLSTIRCATSNLTYKEYMSFSSVFLFVAEAVLGGAQKSISLDSEICFDSELAYTYANKQGASISEEMTIASLLIASLEKTVSLYSEFYFSSDVEFSAEKALSYVESVFAMSGESSFLTEKHSAIDLSAMFISELNAIHTEKHFDDVSAAIFESAVSLVAEKHGSTITSVCRLGLSASFVAARLRKLKDIDNSKLSDIDSWDSTYDPQGKAQDVFAYTDEAVQELKDNPLLTGGIPLVTTYTPEGGVEGGDFEVEVPGLDMIYEGLMLHVRFHTTSDTTGPRLSIKGIKNKSIINRPVSNSGYLGATLENLSLIYKDSMLMLRYQKIMNTVGWVAVDHAKPSAEDLLGAVPPKNGGLGGNFSMKPIGNYLTTNGAESMDAKTPAEVASDIAPHINPVSVGGIPIVTTYTPAGGVDGVDYAADVPGVGELYAGLTITLKLHVVSESKMPTLSVNGGEPKVLGRPCTLTTNQIRASYSETWLKINNTITIQFIIGATIYPEDGVSGNPGNGWVATRMPRVSPNDLTSPVKVELGGTGADNAPDARKNLGIALYDNTRKLTWQQIKRETKCFALINLQYFAMTGKRAFEYEAATMVAGKWLCKPIWHEFGICIDKDGRLTRGTELEAVWDYAIGGPPLVIGGKTCNPANHPKNGYTLAGIRADGTVMFALCTKDEQETTAVGVADLEAAGCVDIFLYDGSWSTQGSLGPGLDVDPSQERIVRSYLLVFEREPKKRYRVQVGSYENKANAERLRDELKGKGYPGFIQEVEG